MPQALRLLIVEDDPTHAELVLRQVRKAGFEPDWKRVDTERDYLENLHPDLDIILSDFEIPQFGGLRALELLQERALGIPFIIISGTIGEEMAVSVMKHGATDYLLKDRLTRLGPAIEQALTQSRLRRERARVRAALRESEERFRQLVENIREAFWVSEPGARRLLYVSPMFETIWGRTVEEACGGQWHWLDSVHPDDAERIAGAILGDPDGRPLNDEYRILRPDGSIRWIHDRSSFVRRDNGSILRVVGAVSDVTERRQLEEQFRQSQKMETVGQLAGGVAHDFNNILTIIQSQASLLRDDSFVDPRSRNSALEILEAANRAASLTRQLLTFSRKQFVQLRSLDLNTIVTDMTRMLGRALGNNIALNVVPAENLPQIFADQGMMEQILLNLAVNARDAMPSGGQLTIATSTVQLDPAESASPGTLPGVGVRLSVTDTGCGMPPEVLARVFEPFFTTKDINKGTGLGLATVHGIVKQHHGSILIDSVVDRGTTFEIIFPASKIAAILELEKPSEATMRGGDETVLVVDDEPALRELMESILQRLGYRTLAAGSGRQALGVLEQAERPIDLLLTDMSMPDGMTGKDLAEKARLKVPGLRILLTSGYSSDLVENLPETLGRFTFLQKPFCPEQLAQAVHESLRG